MVERAESGPNDRPMVPVVTNGKATDGRESSSPVHADPMTFTHVPLVMQAVEGMVP